MKKTKKTYYLAIALMGILLFTYQTSFAACPATPSTSGTGSQGVGTGGPTTGMEAGGPSPGVNVEISEDTNPEEPGQEEIQLASIKVTPGFASLIIGESQTFTAMAIFSDGSTEVASGAQWSGDEGVAGNTFTASKAGNFTITAKYQGTSGSASITVPEPVPTVIEISPSNSTIKINKTVDFTATVTFDDGHSETNPNGLNWDPGNSFTGNEAGEYTIIAEYRGKSGTATVIVEEPNVRSITVTPSQTTIKVGETVSFSALAQFDVGDPRNVTGKATWSPGIDFKGTEAGTYTISAEYKGVSGTATITVQDLYGDAKAVLQSCDFDKARSLIDQMLAGSEKTDLEQEYQTSVELENRLKALVAKANGEYKGGNYRDAFLTLHDALNEAKCDRHRDSINKKIALVNKALLKPYNNAKAALQACDFEKARSLIDQMIADTRKTELEQEYQASVKLENNLKSMVNQARSDYKSCNYDKALVILNNALSQAKCSKHIESIKNKITMAENRKAYEETTKRLHMEAKSLYKRKDYDGALAKLQQAYNHTKCDRYKDSLSSMIAKVQGKRKPSPEEQVAALDCSRYGEAEAYWDDSEKKAKCRCKSGYKPSGNRCVPTRETLVQDLDCSVYPNTYAAWDSKNNRAACFCINNNYKWRRDGKGCIPKSGSGGTGTGGRTGGGNRDWRGWDRNNQCNHLISKIKGFMGMYRNDPRNNRHLKSIAESNAQRARTLGCDQGQINQALGTGGDGRKRQVGRCPPGYYMGNDGTCAKIGSGTFGQ